MEMLLLMSITGLVGLAVSVGMLYVSYQTRPQTPEGFSHQGRDEFFRRVKLNASRLK
jgi:hypothetical protein